VIELFMVSIAYEGIEAHDTYENGVLQSQSKCFVQPYWEVRLDDNDAKNCVIIPSTI